MWKLLCWSSANTVIFLLSLLFSASFAFKYIDKLRQIINQEKAQMSKTSLSLLFAFMLVVCQANYLTSLAHDLAHLQAVSYQSQADIDKWTCPECSKYEVKNPRSFFSSTANIQGVAFYFPKYDAVVVAFRGSVDFKNWLFNLNTVVTSYPACSGCNVHLGFYSAYKGVSPLVRPIVEQLLSQFRGAKLIITGHSLGGAMAAHCALDLKQLHGKIDHLYTFGQPRVGNQNFANYMHSQVPSYYRMINYADTVPHVPQSVLGFKHGGHQIWYDPRGMTSFKQCVSQDKSCSNSISLTSMSTDDHSLTNYMTIPVINQGKNMRKQESINTDNYTDEEIAIAENIKVNRIKQLLQAQGAKRVEQQIEQQQKSKISMAEY